MVRVKVRDDQHMQSLGQKG